MCGFPLAEEQKKRKTFFSHTAGSMGLSVRGGLQVTWCFRVQLFLLPDLPRPPALHGFCAVVGFK